MRLKRNVGNLWDDSVFGITKPKFGGRNEIRNQEKIFLALLGTTVAALLINVVMSEVCNAKAVAMISDRNVEQGRNIISHTVNSQKEQALSLARRYAANEKFTAAVAAGDRVALAELVAPVYQSLHQNNRITVFEFGDTKGLVFFRGHRPDMFGDNKSSDPAIQSVISGYEVSGFVFGRSGLAIRGMVPIKEKGMVVGTFQIGFNLNQDMLSDLSQLVGNIAFYEKDMLTQTTATDELEMVGKHKESGIFNVWLEASLWFL